MSDLPKKVDGRTSNGGWRPVGGRPLKYPEGVRRQQQRARESGANFLPHVMVFWMRTLRDPHADWEHRNRAAENIANRCGLPLKAVLDGDAVGGMTLERMAEIYREAEVHAEISRGRIEAEDTPFTEVDIEKIPTRVNGDTTH